MPSGCSMENSSSEDFMQSLCVFSLLLHSDGTSLDCLALWGCDLLNNPNPSRCRTLRNAWIMYEELLTYVKEKKTCKANDPSEKMLEKPLSQPMNTPQVFPLAHFLSSLRKTCEHLANVSPQGTSPQKTTALNLDTSLWVPFPLTRSPRPIRIFVDGVFDLVHSGHFNALRQAALMGDKLIVGIGSDQEVRLAKGLLPIYTAQERAQLIKACKWVTDIILGTPYSITLAYLEKTGCDFVAHGDDLALNADGKDCYEEIRKASRIKTFRRTEGVSSTTFISRLYKVAKYQENPNQASYPSPLDCDTSSSQEALICDHPCLNTSDPLSADSFGSSLHCLSCHSNQTLVSSWRLSKFMSPTKSRSEKDRVVYVDGCFDVLHAGHISLLEQASQKGSFLIVGVYNDAVVKKLKGSFYPVRGLLERSLCIAAMRCVDQVILDAPCFITPFLMKELHIDLVVHGKGTLPLHSRYDHLVEQNKIFLMQHRTDIGSEIILQRVLASTLTLKESLVKRKQKEDKFYQLLSVVEERPNER